MPGWPGAGSCYTGLGQGWGSNGLRSLGTSSDPCQAALAQPCGIGMLCPFIPGDDALGNLLLQAMSSGLRSQLGPSLVVTHGAVFRGTPVRGPGPGSDGAQRCRQGAGRVQEAVGMEAGRKAVEGREERKERKERKVLYEAAPGCSEATAPQPPAPSRCPGQGRVLTPSPVRWRGARTRVA